MNLGTFYALGLGVKKDYTKAIEYYESSAKLGNSIALLNLGCLYFNGIAVEKDIVKAKEYFEKSARLKNADALFNLGIFYEFGLGVKQDYLMAKDYYELSAKFNNPSSLFRLGELFSVGEFFDIDVQKAIYYYKKCSEIHFLNTANNKITSESSNETYNRYCFRSSNNIGLIYITVLNDLENATKYLKDSGFGEYPYAQNNLGILFEFYLNNLENAKHMYKRSAKNNFSLAEFNLGHFYEKIGKNVKSIECFIKSSEHEKEPLIFQNNIHFDKRLEISKIFIILLANLKLTNHYLFQNNLEESKKYFIKSLSKLTDLSIFQFSFNQEKIKDNFSYLKIFILSHPLFNLVNQPIIGSEVNSILNDLISKFSKGKQNSKKSKNDNKTRIVKCKYKLLKNEIQKDEIIYNDLGGLFDYVISNILLKNAFVEEIQEIISLIEKILYTPPYSFLFGRIDIRKPKPKVMEILYPNAKEINEIFYEGFGLN